MLKSVYEGAATLALYYKFVLSVSHKAKLYLHMTKQTEMLKSIAVFALVSCALACGSSSASRKDVQAIYDDQTGRLRQLTYDSNKNGKPDSISYMDGTTVLRVEIDQDEDGKVERWEYYGADRSLEKVGLSRANDGVVDQWAYRGADGSLVKLEISTKRDGKVQRTEIYEKGTVTAVEEDTDDDGVVDKWETYSGSTLTSVGLDTEKTGRPTRLVMYNPDGSVRIASGPEAAKIPTRR